jgi:alginate O-acetyltransferase complex protein AlgI
MTVMLLGGLWHGASWNFVVWGGLHGGMLALERSRGKRSLYGRLPRPAAMSITFVIVLFSWVFFRAADLGAAVRYCGAMLGLGPAGANAELLAGLIYRPWYVLSLSAAALLVWTAPQTWDFTRCLTWPKIAWIALVFVISVILLTTQSYNPFIYFIF